MNTCTEIRKINVLRICFQNINVEIGSKTSCAVPAE